MFILASNQQQARIITNGLRDLAEKEGRARDAIKTCQMLTVVTGPTDKAAEEKYQEYLSYADAESLLSCFGAWTGIDFSTLDPDKPVEAVENDSARSIIASLTDGKDKSDKRWTVREIIKRRCVGGAGPALIGGAEKVADELERWVDEGGVDGFNLARAISPGSMSDFIDFVVPILQERGRVQTSYKPSTLRQKVIGTPDGRVAKTHVAYQFRNAFKGSESVADKTQPTNFTEEPKKM